MITLMGGYTASKREFDDSLRKIAMLGYGIVLIAHSATRVEKNADGNEIEILTPDLPKRAAEVANGLVDILGYIGGEYDKEGNYIRYLHTRESPTLFAGSRLKYLAPKIKFGYDELVAAVSEAIDMAEKLDGIKVVDSITETKGPQMLSFNETRETARDLWRKLVEKAEENAEIILKKIEIIMGRKMKLSEFTEEQVDLLNLVVLEMKDLIKESE